MCSILFAIERENATFSSKYSKCEFSFFQNKLKCKLHVKHLKIFFDVQIKTYENLNKKIVFNSFRVRKKNATFASKYSKWKFSSFENKFYCILNVENLKILFDGQIKTNENLKKKFCAILFAIRKGKCDYFFKIQ